jgi:hypothetical protein
MKAPTQKHIAFIRKRARVAMIRAQCHGLHFETDDLLAEGFVAFVRARHRYDRLHSSATFSTYLHKALENTFHNLLRDHLTRARTLRTVPYDEEAHAPQDPGSEVELLELVAFYQAQLKNDIDRKVLMEMVFPSEVTLATAKMHSLRSQHLVKRRVAVGGNKHVNALHVTPDVIARSLHITIGSAKNAVHRIRKLIKNNINQDQET